MYTLMDTSTDVDEGQCQDKFQTFLSSIGYDWIGHHFPTQCIIWQLGANLDSQYTPQCRETPMNVKGNAIFINDLVYKNIEMEEWYIEIWRSRMTNTPKRQTVQVNGTQRRHKNVRLHNDKDYVPTWTLGWIDDCHPTDVVS